MFCFLKIFQDGYYLPATMTTPSMCGMFSKEHGSRFCLAMRTVSVHCVFLQMGRPSAPGPGTTLFGYEMSVIVVCSDNFASVCVVMFLVMSSHVCCFDFSRPGLKDEDTDDSMVDNLTEDTPTFLFARVQSQRWTVFLVVHRAYR